MNKEKKLKNIIKYNVVSSLVSSLTFVSVLIILMIIFKDFISPYMKIINIVFLLICIILSFETFIKPFIDAKIYKHEITDKKIEYTRGIFVIKRNILPINRVQQVSLINTFLLNKFNLVKIEITTITDTHTLENISKEEGEQIVKSINDILYEDLNKVNDEVDNEEL